MTEVCSNVVEETECPDNLTYHAPVERAACEQLAPVAAQLQDDALLRSLLEGFPEIAVIIEGHRQIVACNGALLGLLEKNTQDIIGKRIGEVLGCVHATDMPGGCGTSESCQTCGAVNAILGCQQSGKAMRDECRLSTGSDVNPQACELEVVVTPLAHEKRDLMVLAARNISASKRREVLERFFFHDILNLAGGIQGLAELEEESDLDSKEVLDRLGTMSRQLVEQLRAQRDLVAAERGELQPLWSMIPITELFEDLRSTYASHPVAASHAIEFEMFCGAPRAIETDRVLLNRVLGNLIKNALEASEPGDPVRVSCSATPNGEIQVEVHNRTVMPKDVQLQVFRRSFSTKSGSGRGVGTFSVQLLTSRYLGGRVSFLSREGAGTSFYVQLPLRQTKATLPEVSPAVAIAPRNPLADLRILVAEDQSVNQLLMERRLQKEGARTTIAANGELAVREAVAALQAGEPFDVILMDVQMPLMDGYEATRLLRRKGYPGAIIALTANDGPEDRAQCLAAGCDDYIAKPVDFVRLLKVLETCSKWSGTRSA